MKPSSWFKKNRFALFLTLVILIAFGLRIFKLSEWQYLQHDQGRDLIKVSEVVAGERPVPLLGPRASGENLFLGPIFYYFQICSALAWGEVSPLVLTLPDLFFSILTIPLLYFFLRHFFSKRVSFLVTVVFAFSYIFTQYARFAWNPNSIPFWSLLLMSSILRIQITRNRSIAGLWLLLAALSFGVVSQLHFIAFLGFPFAILLFWIFYRPMKIPIKFWAGAIVIFLLLNLPLILNDTICKGSNWREFFGALSVGITEKRGFLESLLKVAEFGSANLATILSSLNNKELGVWWLLVSLICIDVLFLAALYWQDGYKNKLFFETITKKQRVFLVLNFCWILGFSPLYFKLAFDVDNLRFWFPVSIFPFVALALYLKFLFYLERISKVFLLLAYGLVIVLLGLNLTAIGKWYISLAQQKEVQFFNRTWTSRSFRQNNLETSQNQRAIAQYIVQDAKRKGSGICLHAPNELITVFKYFILKEMGFEGFFKKKGIKNKKSFAAVSDRCTVYLIDRTEKSEEKILHKLGAGKFNLGKKHSEGSLSVWLLSLEKY